MRRLIVVFLVAVRVYAISERNDLLINLLISERSNHSINLSQQRVSYSSSLMWELTFFQPIFQLINLISPLYKINLIWSTLPIFAAHFTLLLLPKKRPTFLKLSYFLWLRDQYFIFQLFAICRCKMQKVKIPIFSINEGYSGKANLCESIWRKGTQSRKKMKCEILQGEK